MATLFELAAQIQAAGGAEGMLLMIAKATLILAIARVLLAAMPRASAATRHAVATAALVGVAAMPVLTFLTPAWNIVVAQAKETPAAVTTVTPSAGPTPTATPRTKTIGVTGDDEAASSATAGRTSSSIGTAFTIARATGVVPDEPLGAVERAMNVVKSTWKGMIVVAFWLVAVLMLAQMVLGIFGVWFVARRAEEVTHDEALRELDYAHDQLALGREVRLLRSSRISVPVLWGFFRPVLLLPADVVTWPAERIRVVLLHELAHLKRYDGISLILTRIAVSLFWYHPLAWSLERAGRNDCERSCDDLVLAGGTKPSVYADHLLAIARSMPSFDPFRSVTLAMSRKTQLEGRLLSILQPHVVRRAFSGRNVAIACAFAIMLIVPLSALRLIAAPPKDQDRPAAIAEKKDNVKSNSDVTVTPDIEAIEDYLLTKLGKYDKRIDKLTREPRNGRKWYERAYNLYNNERYADAAVAFKRAAEEGHRDDTALYNAACSYALLGEVEPAVQALQAAIDAGWDDVDKIAEDSDFDPIRSDPRFARAVNIGSSEVVTRRVAETMARYEDLKAGRTTSSSSSISSAIAGGIAEGVTAGVAAAMAAADAVKDGVKGGGDPDFDFDFDFDYDHNDKEWFSVGLDLLRLRRLDESIDAFQKSIDEQERVSTSMYNIACAYSLKGDAGRGMQWLEKAINEGFSGDEKLMNDPDIALLRKQGGFDTLRRRAVELELRGCCHDDDDDDYDGDDVKEWAKIVDFHTAVTRKYPQAGRAWFNLGFAALQARQFETGIDAFHRAISLNHRVSTSSYNIACGYALKGDRDAAFLWLDKARDAGFELRNHMGGDDDLDSLHSDPRWDTLRREVRARMKSKSADKHK